MADVYGSLNDFGGLDLSDPIIDNGNAGVQPVTESSTTTAPTSGSEPALAVAVSEEEQPDVHAESVAEEAKKEEIATETTTESMQESEEEVTEVAVPEETTTEIVTAEEVTRPESATLSTEEQVEEQTEERVEEQVTVDTDKQDTDEGEKLESEATATKSMESDAEVETPEVATQLAAETEPRVEEEPSTDAEETPLEAEAAPEITETAEVVAAAQEAISDKQETKEETATEAETEDDETLEDAETVVSVATPKKWRREKKVSAGGKSNFHYFVRAVGQLCVWLLGFVVIAAGVAWYFWRQEGEELEPGLVADFQTKQENVATVGKCKPVVVREVKASVDDFAEAVASEMYQDVELTDELKEQFNYFQKYSLGTNAVHCFALEYCRNDFGQNIPFALAFARQAYVMHHFGADHEIIPGGMWQPVSRLKEDVAEYFGLQNVEMGFYPLTGDQVIADVYNGADGTFLIADEPNINGPYQYQLIGVRQHDATRQRVFIAEAKPTGSSCVIEINQEKCECPQARYYLVQEVSPATGKLVYSRELVQVLDEGEDK